MARIPADGLFLDPGDRVLPLYRGITHYSIGIESKDCHIAKITIFSESLQQLEDLCREIWRQCEELRLREEYSMQLAGATEEQKHLQAEVKGGN